MSMIANETVRIPWLRQIGMLAFDPDVQTRDPEIRLWLALTQV